MIAMSMTDPEGALLPLAAAATCVAFASATQDIAIDAWRTESFDETRAAAAASVHVTGYRIAMLASGAGALLLHGPLGLTWPQVYLVCGCVMLLGVVGVVVAPRPTRTVPAMSIDAAFVRPVADILLRRGAIAMLAFVVLFRLPDVLAGSMTMPFLRKTGFGDTEIAAVRQGLGVFVTIAGVLAGGFVAARVGLRRALLVYGILQAVSNLAFCWLAVAGADTGALTVTVVIENFCGGLVTAGFLGFLQRQCSPGLAATQFALLTSLMALPRTVVGVPAGWMADALGWPGFFAATAALGVPGLMLLPWLERRSDAGTFDAPAPVPSEARGG
jgi:PAT family beta-lactamase induction signal transducer AmpG